MRSLNRNHIAHLALICLFIVVGVPLTVELIFRQTDLQFSEVTNLTSAVGSILLSAVLAYLYLRMWSTQEERTSVQQNQEEILDRQAEIQEKQHELLQTEKEALLDILRRDIEDDDCQLTLSNHGAGAVVQLHIATRLSSSSEGFSGGQKSTQLSRNESSSGGKVLGPNERNVEMKCCPMFEARIGDDLVDGSFSAISTSLKSNDIGSVQVQITLVTVDEFGHPDEETLLNKEISIHQNMHLDEIRGLEE